MKISFSPYLLRRRKSGFQQGALIRISDGKNWGVADICPRIDLGDLPFEEEIQHQGKLYSRTIELAQEDFVARKNRISLLQNRPVRNNFLILDFTHIDLDLFSGQTIKIKAGPDVEALSQKLNRLNTDVKIRLDFNNCLAPSEFDKFLDLLGSAALRRIEYIEDPTPLCNEWQNWNKKISLAFDFQHGSYDPDYARFRIIKPSRQNLPDDLRNITLTSAMDHPVGVAHALRIAQAKATSDSGLLTLDIYDDNIFTKYFEQKQNYLNFTDLALHDSGIGMSEELTKLQWTDL